MPKLIIPEPNEKQKRFLEANNRFIGYGGARGGGKSWAIRTKAVLLALEYAGIKICIVRRSFPELEENHINPLKEMLNTENEDKRQRIARYNGSAKKFTFPNKSVIFMRYCELDKDAERFQGKEYDVVFIDEATHQTEERFVKINASVRGVNDFPKRLYVTCNPGGVGHNWVKRLFIKNQFNPEEDPNEYTFIQAKLDDNKILMEKDPSYCKQLNALPPKLRKAWLDGSWDVFDGQYFEEFVDDEEHYYDRKYTHVIAPLPLEQIRDMTIYRGYDWGYAKPFSCAWYGVDRDGVLYRLMEWYGCRTNEENVGIKLSNEEQFRKIHQIEKEHPYFQGKNIIGYADPSIWDASRGESTAETAAKCGVYFNKGDNARIQGWMQCRYRLHFDENGYPKFYVFNNCREFIRTIPSLIFSENSPEDLDTTGEDHIADEWRYVCMARPVAPPIHQEKEIPDMDDPLNQRVPKHTQFAFNRI